MSIVAWPLRWYTDYPVALWKTRRMTCPCKSVDDKMHATQARRQCSACSELACFWHRSLAFVNDTIAWLIVDLIMCRSFICSCNRGRSAGLLLRTESQSRADGITSRKEGGGGRIHSVESWQPRNLPAARAYCVAMWEKARLGKCGHVYKAKQKQCIITT